MARRGEVLREHILSVAKHVFLECGFERTSMDEVASRAQTSKRSLYAHFESKDKLFLAVIEMVRGLFLNGLGTPDDHAKAPEEALALFCGRYLELLIYQGWVKMMRMSMAEAERFPEQAAQCFDVAFRQVQVRIATYLQQTFGLSSQAGTQAAQQLLAQVLYPRLQRALFGLDFLAPSPPDSLGSNFDLEPIRAAVAGLIASLSGQNIPPSGEA